jgi:regulator of RNase E activity RraA
MNFQNIRNLVEFDTPTVANGLDRLELRDPTIGYTGPDIRCLMPEMGPKVGIAVTARMDTTTAGMDDPAPRWLEWVKAMRDAAHSDGAGNVPVFAVIESVGPRPRHTVTIGDGMGTIMRMAGAAGFVTNGSIRDLEGVREVPLACWAAGVSPMHGKIRWLDVNSPVVIDGMTVNPGDFIHADVNGTLVMPPDAADQVYDKAKEVREAEQSIFAKYRTITIDEYLTESERSEPCEEAVSE